ncbi:META domain-containing protein [Streptomyces adelaidensis]|uniref:META domain-containing protein n=1 Tax=Streptomyces adelaidensis TaxID=2796465 RepID=UPI001908CFDD|nr:META domain-containing protein [Streptomyces adelaidensis]
MDMQRLTRTALPLTALTLLPLLAACGTESGSGSGSGSVGSGTTKASVTGVRWAVDSLTVDGKTAQAPGGAYLKIADDGEVNGNYGCNTFGSTAAFEDDGIDFEAARSTEMACGDAPMKFEESFARALDAEKFTAETTDGGLTLTTADGDTVKLSEEKPAELYATKWRVDSLLDHDVASSLPEAAEGKAWFTLDKKAGTVNGSLGCNEVSARATVSDDKITLGNPRTTRKMCSDSLMATERALLEVFKGTVEYRIDHRSITLTSENNVGIGAVADK